jgi:hypothetical protein
MELFFTPKYTQHRLISRFIAAQFSQIDVYAVSIKKATASAVAFHYFEINFLTAQPTSASSLFHSQKVSTGIILKAGC